MGKLALRGSWKIGEVGKLVVKGNRKIGYRRN